MVQILKAPEREPSVGEKLMQAVRGGVQAFGQYRQGQKQNEALRQAGIDPNLPQEFQKLSHQSKLKREEQAQKLTGESEAEARDYKVVSDRFGKEFADTWRAAPIGGRTELLKFAIENYQRGEDIGQLLRDSGMNAQQPTSQENVPSELSEEGKPKERFIDYDKGLTPKERTSRQNARYTQALPLYTASQQKVHSYDMMGEEIGTLQQLSPQISGWERLNINPTNGELIIPAAASAEAQQFVKTVNDFTIQAKDSYGSRVTNFDLNQFMRRLPTLANSAEGRERILEQMSIINDLNKMYEQSLHKVLDDHGGIRNIDWDKASDIAYKKFQKDSVPLKKQLKDLSSSDNREFKLQVSEKKRKAPPGTVLMMTPDGTFGYVAEKEVAEALKDGLTQP